HYLGLEIVRVPVAEDHRADPAAMAAAIDPSTVMLVGSAPCFPYGLMDPIAELSDLAMERDVWLHVDACVGAYLAPFARMNGVDVPPFDFELPGVASVSGDLHKYGYTAKGASTLYHRTPEQRAYQIFESGDWPAGHMTTPTLAGTRPGGAMASAWAVIQYLGESGYREKAQQVCATREKLSQGIDAMEGLSTYGDGNLGIMLYGADDVDIYHVYGRMLARGWFSGLVTDPRAIHLMLSPAHAEVADFYLADLADSLEEVRTGTTAEPTRTANYNT
ncbi:MAG: aminotransferase class V-fold PLP-dependent enzyme, partial [Myxococcota bacterium]